MIIDSHPDLPPVTSRWLGPIALLLAVLSLACAIMLTIAAARQGAGPLGVMLCVAVGVIDVMLLMVVGLQQRHLRQLATSRDKLRATFATHERAQLAEWGEREDLWSRHLVEVTAALQRFVSHLVEVRVPAAVSRANVPPAIHQPLVDEDVSTMLEGVVSAVSGVAVQHFDRQEALRGILVALARRVQPGSHRIQEAATHLAEARPGDELVQATMMRIDHAAAQQARAAQGLAVLCQDWPGQQWLQPLALVEVVRAASGRIVDFRRIKVIGDLTVAAAAPVVEPLIHLIAELLANATVCSPPTTDVEVTVRLVQRGAVITIDDGGIGLDEHRLAKATDIASGRRLPELEDLVDSLQTGLPVVGILARRHGFGVALSDSPFGGVRAVVLVPEKLVQVLDGEDALAIGRPSTTPPSAARSSSPQPAEAAPAAPAVTSGTTAARPQLPQRRSPRHITPQPSPDRSPAPPARASSPGSLFTPQEPGDFLGNYLEGAHDVSAVPRQPSPAAHDPAHQEEQ
ncbi:ATP-binding protein [Nonomuraea dietziae]